MNDSSAPHITSTQRLRLIRRKRYALEQLIHFAKNMAMQTRALEDIMVLTRPSQVISDEVRKNVVYMTTTLEGIAEAELKKRLIRVDRLVIEGVKAILHIVHNVGQFEMDTQRIIEQIDRIKDLILLFKKRTELCIALRIVLQEHGIVPPRLQIKFSQQALVRRVKELKKEEIKCRTSLRNHVQDVIIDCDNLLAMKGIGVELSGELKQVKQVMQVNLEHINAGKSIESLPINFEAIDLGESSPAEEQQLGVSIPTQEDENPAIPSPEDKTHHDQQQPNTDEQFNNDKTDTMSFSSRLSKWINTPINVSWSDIKSKKRKR